MYPPFKQPDFLKETEEEVAANRSPWTDDDEQEPGLLSQSDSDSDSDENYNSAKDTEDAMPLDTLRNKLIMRKKKMNMPSGHERRNLLHLPHDKTMRMLRLDSARQPFGTLLVLVRQRTLDSHRSTQSTEDGGYHGA